MLSASVLIAGSGNITGLNVIRALDGKVERLIGCDCAPVEENPANIFCENFTVPRVPARPVEHGFSYIDAIIQLVLKRGINYIIASNDHEVRELLRHHKTLSELNVVINAVPHSTMQFLDKLKTSKLFQEKKIPTPTLYEFYCPKPYVLRKRLAGMGQKYTYIVRTDLDAKEVPFIEHKGFNVGVTTKYLEGEEYTIDILAMPGNATIVVPRLRKVVKSGMVHHGVVVNDPALIAAAGDVSTKLEFDGIYCIKCIKNCDKYWFFEVNPRPGSGLDLTIAAGANLPLMWLQRKLGAQIDAPDVIWGTNMVRYMSGYYYQ